MLDGPRLALRGPGRRIAIPAPGGGPAGPSGPARPRPSGPPHSGRRARPFGLRALGYRGVAPLDPDTCRPFGLLLGGGLDRGGLAEAPLEPGHAAAGVEDLLLARVERVAVR